MKLKTLLRSARADVKIDPEKRTLEFSFSSEFPVERWFGTEILSHKAGAADLSRMNDGAPLLWNHDTDQVLGVVEKAWIGTDKRGYVSARFSENPKAVEVQKDIESGILRNVSFAYRIQDMECLNPGADAEPEYLATKWLAYEASIVSVPADPTVGIGRSLRGEQNEEIDVNVTNERALRVKETRMNEEELKKQQEEQKRLAKIEGEKIRDEAIKLERERTSTIQSIGLKLNKTDLAKQLIESGASLDTARTAFLESVGETIKPVTEREALIGLSDKDKKRYSFMNAIRAVAFPQDPAFQKAAAFELEISNAALKVPGANELRGIGLRIPFDILREVKDFSIMQQRADLIAGTGSLGGHTVATELLAGSFIDLLRNKMVTRQAGATILNGLQGNIAIPRQTGGATAYYVAENSAITESEQAFDQVTMNPKTVGAFSDFSRRLLLQSSIDVENFVKTDLAKVLALEVDRASLYGSGSANQPTGLQSQTSVGTVDFVADAPTWGEIVDMEAALAAANADDGSLAFLTNGRGRGVLKKTLVTATYGDRMIWGADNLVNGYRPLVSNQVSRVSSGKEHYWLGNWADLLIGFWSGLDLLTDPYAGATAGTVRVIAMQDFDVACRHGESFCLGSNLT